ncbi:MAG: gamma-glutamyl-gamma-aminobutyrate hydrolase family protein [Blastocatellia bacterium]|nr:gamma-glutamyl-gamma-aminobutyrate hydrolase family protein [Blastocatellia bacterium]
MTSMVSNRPVIGITTRLNHQDETNYLKSNYGEAIFQAGGLPILIPLIPSPAYIDSLISHLDGILLTGSNSDVDPMRYGQAAHLNLEEVHFERDEVDHLLLTAAEAQRLPVLGICYGLQAINVFRGGTLFQDLPAQVENVIQHRQRGPVARLSHGLQINRESLLAKLAGGTSVRVNSVHHQAIDELGSELEAIAWSADGVIEAVISTKPGQFILGVQWHPEINWSKDTFSQAIFKHFVAEAAVRG